MPHHFSASLVWTGAADGPTRDYDAYSREYEIKVGGRPTLVLSADKAFRGDPTLHNPEDLLIASIAGCHFLSYLALCAKRGILVSSYSDDCSGRMEVRDGVMRFVEVTLNPVVGLAAGDSEVALRLHEDAHRECFIAASVNFPVICRPTIQSAVPSDG